VKRRLTIITEIISPYRIPLFNALAKHPQVDLHVVFLSETDPSLRQWHVYKNEIEFSCKVLPSWRKRVGKFNLLLNRGLTTALLRASPDAILCGGYSYLASWQALAWARKNRVPFLLWSESNLQDRRRGHTAVEFLKTEFLRRCSAFAVPGQTAREYLRFRGIRDEIIFAAPNAVDNDLFAAAAAEVWQNPEATRSRLNLPQRYFLYVGRLVREKGVFDLLAAYEKLDESTRQSTGLVFVGDGAARGELEAQAATVCSGMLTFAGFVHREELAAYYALAEALFLPTYSDPWGLVVNEAMACGIPAVVSQIAGCAADLIVEGWNGWLIPPGDTESLSRAMRRLIDKPELRALMGANSLERISQYSPQAWASGIARSIENAGVKSD
jgi:1,2-diacylglycerol 3-alpha-glucosyltransferase